jgi:hypothetical protein
MCFVSTLGRYFLRKVPRDWKCVLFIGGLVAQYMPVAHVEIRKGRRSTYKLAQFDEMSICIDKIVSCDYYVCGQRLCFWKINVSERDGNSFLGIRLGLSTLYFRRVKAPNPES